MATFLTVEFALLVTLFIHFEIERLDHEVILKPSPKFQNQDLVAQFAWLQYVQDDETRSFRNCSPVEDFLIKYCINADVKFLTKLLASICWPGLDHGICNRIWQTGVAHTKRIDCQHCLTSIAYRKKALIMKQYESWFILNNHVWMWKVLPFESILIYQKHSFIAQLGNLW